MEGGFLLPQQLQGFGAYLQHHELCRLQGFGLHPDENFTEIWAVIIAADRGNNGYQRFTAQKWDFSKQNTPNTSIISFAAPASLHPIY